MVLYYSMFGNTFRLAEGVCQGIQQEGGEPILRTVPELIPLEVLDKNPKMKQARELQKNIPVLKLDELEHIDGLILGSPTRFGNMCSQLRNVLDQTTSLWLKGTLIGKPAGVFCCTASMHGGQETTLISIILTLIHHGAVIVGVPYSVKELVETTSGGTPYGPTAVVGISSDRPPTPIDLKIASAFGGRVTKLAAKLK
jgi:NAD(P)H dehydrogenase (quinone)